MSIMDLIKKGKKNREKKVRAKALKNVAIGAAIGTTLGAVAGVFLAPKSGKENREDIVKAAHEIPEKAKEIIEKAENKAKDLKDGSREYAIEVLKKLDTDLGKLNSRLQKNMQELREFDL